LSNFSFGSVIRIAVGLHRQPIDLEQLRLPAVQAREAAAGFLVLALRLEAMA